jgi:hypothetical protein
MGVITRFWTNANAEAETSEMVMLSLRTASLKVRDAVAGVPEASAVTVTVVSGVIVSGIPESWTTFAETLDNVSPVPASAGALKLTGLPEAATAANRMVDG